MAREFVVEVSMPPELDQGAVIDQLSQAFRVDSAKVASLLRRLPSAVTKPVSESEAQAVARRFTEAGLRAVVLPLGDADPSPVPSAPAAQAQSPAPAQPPDVSTGRAAAGHGAAAVAATPSGDPTPEAVPDSDRAAKRARAKLQGKPRRKAGSKRADAQGEARRPAGSIRGKLMSVAIIPTVLTILGALTVIWLTARPALYDQLLESARNPAIATAASLSAVLEEDTAGGSDYLELLDTILVARQAFERQNIAFIVATDVQGNPLSGYVTGSEALAADRGTFEVAVQEQAQFAVAQHAAGNRTGETVSSQIPGAGGARIEVVAQPLLKNGEPFGAVVVGVSDVAVTRQVNTMLLYIFLFSLIPIALAILIAYLRARALTRNVLFLTDKADQISRGDLEESVELKSNDELENLSQALERMRVSMKEALERLRRRRI